MLLKIQSVAQTRGARIFALIICAVLVLFGFGAFSLFTISEPTAAVVNDVEITAREFSNALDRRKRQYEQRLGDDVDPQYVEQLVEGDKSAILTQMVNTEIFRQQAHALGLVASERDFVASIRSDPVFQEDGEFSEQRFATLLSQSGFSPATYEARMGEDSLVDQLVRVHELTSFVTDRELRDVAALANQSRDVAYLAFAAEDFKEDVEITDEEVAEYYQLNQASYMSNELFGFEYVELNSERFVAPVELSEEELVALYEEEVKALGDNTQRRAAHILVTVHDDRTLDEARLEILDAFARLENGESFSDVATEISEDPGSASEGGDLGWAGRGVYVAPFETALYDLEVGEISEPVETEFGVHLIKLLEVADVEIPSFDSRREALREEEEQRAALEEFDEAFNELDELAYELTLADVAEQLDLEIQTMDNVTRFSVDGPLISYAARSAIFDTDVIENGFNSRAAIVAEGRALVARMVSRTEPEQRSLAEVKEQIRVQLERDKSHEAAIEAADAVYDRLSSADVPDYAAIASEFETEWEQLSSVTQASEELPARLREDTFNAPQPSTGNHATLRVEAPPIEYVVVVSRVELASYDEIAEADQEDISTSLDTLYKNKAVVGYINSLRNSASIELTQ